MDEPRPFRLLQPDDCSCDGAPPWCPACLVAAAWVMRQEHPQTLGVAMLRRRIPGLTGREAAILVEATRNGKYR